TPRRAAFDRLVGRLEPATAPAAALDADDLAMLGALGYVGTGDVLAPGGDVDPQDVIDEIPMTWSARQAIAQGRLDVARVMVERLRRSMPGAFGVRQLDALLLEAEGRVEEALELQVGLYLESPSSTLAQQIGDLYLQLGQAREAEGWYLAALDQLAVAPRAMAGLVRAALALGEPERADELARRFLVTFPDQAELHLVLAEALLLDHRPREALAEAELGERTMPWSMWALTTTARARWELGRADPAIERLQQALALHPFDVPTRLLLTRWLLDVGRRAEAVRTISPLGRAMPEDREIGALWSQARAALDAERAR
ncbi:MAG TPA: tetratricopeptide repeat protein, partial [Myxococcota bacterium]|nr:tetratricopeptide repeat protein [Myxococcota bacterium]